MHSKCCFSSSGAPASGFRSPVSKSTKTLCCELSSSLLSVLLKVVNTVERFQELLLWLWPDLDCKQTLTLKSNIYYHHVSKGNLRGSRSLFIYTNQRVFYIEKPLGGHYEPNSFKPAIIHSLPVFRRGEGGHDTFISQIICSKNRFCFFSYWSRNNTYCLLSSD